LKARAATVIAATLAVIACAHPPPVRTPESEDLVYPAARPGELRPGEAEAIEKAWRKVLTGDVTGADRAFRRILAARPGLLPAETGLAFAHLRAGRIPEAGNAFDSALARRPEYLPALMGAASVAVRKGDLDRALDLYRRAAAAEPADSRARRRLAEVKLRVTEKRVAEAKKSIDDGNTLAATLAYKHALDAAPEVAGLRLALAELYLGEGEAHEAAAVLAADPGGDRLTRLRLAEVLSGLGEYRQALETLNQVLAKDPRDPEARIRARETREALILSELPEEYRRIAIAPRVSRAELAALLCINVSALARLPGGEPKVAVDISGSWARNHIARVLALDVMDLFPNHTFQPGVSVRRGDLARSAARVLDLVGARAGPGAAPVDMAPANAAYEAVVRVVGAGLMELNGEGGFEPGRAVTGREGLDVIEALGRATEP
jgi:thioredoxin-like negative regulator of GroEL